jgi:hypothetical protein
VCCEPFASFIRRLIAPRGVRIGITIGARHPQRRLGRRQNKQKRYPYLSMTRSLALVGIFQSCGPARLVWVTQPELKGVIDKDGSKTIGFEVAVILRTSCPKIIQFALFSFTSPSYVFMRCLLQVSYWRPYFRLSLKVHKNHTFPISTPGVSYFPGHHGPIKSASTHPPACPRCRLSADWRNKVCIFAQKVGSSLLYQEQTKEKQIAAL